MESFLVGHWPPEFQDQRAATLDWRCSTDPDRSARWCHRI